MSECLRFLQSLVILGLLIVPVSCAPRLAGDARFFDPLRLASGVEAGPGKAAWSRDGNRLAYIVRGTVRIVALDRGADEKTDFSGATYIAWTDDDELLILGSTRGPRLAVLQPSSALREYPLEAEAAGVFDFNRDKVILAYLNKTERSYGTELATRIETLNLSSSEKKKIHEINRTYLAKNMDENFLKAWMHGGLNPLDRSLLVMEYLRPPVVGAYTRFKKVAPGRSTAELLNDEKNFYYSAAWSPAGDRIAASAAGGEIEIIDLLGKRSLVRTGRLGYYPSWNPRGSLLYIGGMLIDSAGERVAGLMKPAPASIGWWSPDGSKLAVAAEGDLWLFRNIDPGKNLRDRIPAKETKTKMRQLLSLFEEGFLSEQELAARQVRLLEGMEYKP